MKRVVFAGLIGLALTAKAAFGIVIIPAPIPERVASSEVIVVGKVTGFADKTASATPLSGGPDKVEYQVANVQVSEAVLGAKDAKEVQVGFIPRPPAGVGPRPILGRNAPPQLTVDEEALMLLTRHPDAPFYVAQHFYDVIDKSSPTYDKDLEQVKRCVKLLADPMAGLKAKEADDRLLTAAMLVTRYRTPKAWAQKTEAIGAEESKRILQALAEADWTPKAGDAFVTTPDKAFAQLGLTDKDGWAQPADFNDYPEAAKKWLKDNADKYRIQRFVADEKKDK